MENEQLAALAAQYESEDIEAVEVAEAEEVAEVVEEIKEAEAVEEEHNPPGFIDNIEDYVAAGKDPDTFRGKKAYEAEYERIQEVKELKTSFKSMQDTLKSTVDAIAQRDEQTSAQHKKELEAALNSAKEIGDTDAALDAQEQIHALKPAAPARQVENPVIGEFFSSNPVLESPEIKSELARIYNGKLRADGVGADEQLSDAAMKGYLRASMDSVKTIFPDRFVSPKLDRQTTPKLKAKPAAKALDIEGALRSFKVEGASSRNQDAAIGIYNMLKKSNPSAAETYAKNILGVK